MRPPTFLVLLTSLALAGCVSAARQQRAAARADLGVAMLREGSTPQAIETLREATRLDPRNYRAWDKLGVAYGTTGAYELSEKAFDKALRLNPNSGEILNNYGLFLLGQGRIDEAVLAFETATKDLVYRRPALPLSNLGYTLYLAGRNDEAITRLTDAIQRAPNLCEARFHRGLAWKAKGDQDQALSDLEGAISLCGNASLGAYVAAAPLLFSMGRTDEGCAHLAVVTKEAPTSPMAQTARTLQEASCP